MNPKLARFLARSPKAMIRYQATARLPLTFRPTSPLIELLESLTPRERFLITGIRLSPALGYQCSQTFANAEQLYRFLKPQGEMIEGEPFPAESRRIKRFTKRLSIEDLRDHQARRNGLKTNISTDECGQEYMAILPLSKP